MNALERVSGLDALCPICHATFAVPGAVLEELELAEVWLRIECPVCKADEAAARAAEAAAVEAANVDPWVAPPKPRVGDRVRIRSGGVWTVTHAGPNYSLRGSRDQINVVAPSEITEVLA